MDHQIDDIARFAEKLTFKMRSIMLRLETLETSGAPQTDDDRARDLLCSISTHTGWAIHHGDQDELRSWIERLAAFYAANEGEVRAARNRLRGCGQGSMMAPSPEGV